MSPASHGSPSCPPLTFSLVPSLTAPHSVKDDGKRYTFSAVISSLRTREYSGGTMILFDAEDNTGLVGGIVWNDTYNIFADVLKQGDTFKFYNVQVKANPRNNNRLEVRMYSDTRIERCEPLAITRTYDTIDGAKTSERETVHVKAVVSDISDEVETTRSSDEMRRGLLLDPTGELPFFLLNDAVKLALSKGDVVQVAGRLSNNGAVFANEVSVVKDEALSAFFATQTQPPVLAAKKQRVDPTISRLLDVKSADVGTRGEFGCIVRSRSAVPAPLANDRVKHTFVLVDPSMGAVEVGVFLGKSDAPPTPDVGDTVRFEATVSSYNTRSLTTNAIAKTDDAALKKWYADLSASTTFDEVSVDSRPPPTGGDE